MYVAYAITEHSLLWQLWVSLCKYSLSNACAVSSLVSVCVGAFSVHVCVCAKVNMYRSNGVWLNFTTVVHTAAIKASSLI